MGKKKRRKPKKERIRTEKVQKAEKVEKPEKEKTAGEKKKEEEFPITKEERMQEVKKLTKGILDKYGKLVKCIVVMGSVAREEFKPKSDIDVFVVIDDTGKKITRELHDKIDADINKMANK